MARSGMTAAVAAGLLALVAAGCADTGRGGPAPSPTPAALTCRLDSRPAAVAPVRRGELLAWPARGSLAGDTGLVRRVVDAWRARDPEAPDPAAARVLYAGRLGDRTVVVLQGRMADTRLTMPVFDAAGQRPELLGAATLAWPGLAQLSFLLPPGPGTVDAAGERRLRSPRVDLLVLGSPAATGAGWLRSVPDAPTPRAMALEQIGLGGFAGQGVDVRELVGIQVCDGTRLVYAGPPEHVGPGFGREPGDELHRGPLSVLEQAATGLVGWQLAARADLVRPTGPTACVAVRDPLDLGVEPAETCGVEVGRRDPVVLGGATLGRQAVLLTVAHAVALPQTSRVVFEVDGVAVAASPRRLPGFDRAVFAAAALRSGWARVEAVAYDAAGRELGRAPGHGRDGRLVPDPAPPPFVRDRARLRSCGAYQVGHDGRLGQADQAKLDCFWAALAAGRPAELSVTRPTIEGDPLTILYRALPDRGGVELLTDATRDRFGSGSWHRQVCDPGPRNPNLLFPDCRAA